MRWFEKAALAVGGAGLVLFFAAGAMPVRRNAAGKRRTTSRKRRRGRPGGRTVANDHLTLRMPWGDVEADLRGGVLHSEGSTYGSIYDLGTSFRAIPYGGGEPKSFTTLAGAAKHVLLNAWTA